MMLVNLDVIRTGELRERIEDAWLQVAPPQLHEQVAAD
jgi:hypothetical protein